MFMQQLLMKTQNQNNSVSVAIWSLDPGSGKDRALSVVMGFVDECDAFARRNRLARFHEWRVFPFEHLVDDARIPFEQAALL